jgi:SAM-dependent methyltransferase
LCCDRFIAPGLLAPWARDLIQRADLQPGEQVLDVACGTGLVTLLAAPLVGMEGSVVGVDISPAMLGVARAKDAPGGATIEWREGSAVALPCDDQAFDVVLCQQGLQFFPDRPAAVREMARVLKPGGRLCLNVWCDLALNPGQAAIEAAGLRQLGVSTLASAFVLHDPVELTALLVDGGFKDVSVLPLRLEAHFASSDVFVQSMVIGAAAVLKHLAEMSEDERADLINKTQSDVATALARYVGSDGLAYPTEAHVALARR